MPGLSFIEDLQMRICRYKGSFLIDLILKE